MKYRLRDFLIFAGAFFHGTYDWAKENNTWMEAIPIWILGAIPFTLSAFIVCFFAKKSISGEYAKIKKREKELEVNFKTFEL